MSELGQKLIEETRKVAAERPDFVYPGQCYYVEHGQPGCILGHVLWNLGIIDEDFSRLDENGLSIPRAFPKLGIEIDSDEFHWLSRVQHAQDSKQPWGEAIKEADAGPTGDE